MYSYLKLLAVVPIIGFTTVGCGSPDSRNTASKKESESAVLTTAPAVTPPVSAPSPAQSASSAATPAPTETTIQAEVTSFEPAKSVAEPSVKKSSGIAQVQVEAATAKDAIAAINLLDLPRMEEKNVLQHGPTYNYFSCKGTLPEADAYYKKLLASRGWKELPPMLQPTEQYIDRLFEKDGFCIQISLSLGSERGELGIVMSNLGNVDMRSLPRLSEAEALEPSSRINVTYKTEGSIPDAADAVHKLLTQAGWQLWQPFQPSPINVPHYRDIHYRKQACRLLVGIHKNPQNPADPTSVSYLSEFVTPFDIPMLDNSQTLKLDLFENRAAFETSKARNDLVSFLQSNSQKFGWKIGDTDKFEAGEAHMMPIHVESGTYLVARLVESGGKYSGHIEYFAKEPKSVQPPVDTVASDDATPSSTSATTTTAADATFDSLQAQVETTIQSELAKALGSLGSSAAPKMSLAELQAKAEELQANFGASEETEQDEPTGNPFDVAEDTSAPSPEIQSIKKSIGTVKYGDQSFKLSHVASYVIKEYDRPTKCIIFSDSPIDTEKLKRTLLKEGQPVHGMHVSENAKAMVDFRVSEGSVSLNAQLGSMSMGVSTSKFKADLCYYQGKIAGKIATTEPIDIGDNYLELAMTISEPAIQIDWSKRNSPESMKLVADKTKEYLLPEDCNNLSSEGSKYSKKIEATIEAPLALVQAFYTEELEKQGWKSASEGSGGIKRYQLKDQEMALKLESNGSSTSIKIQTRDTGAAKADAMLPPLGKALLALGNMSDSTVQMSIAGKQYKVAPSMEGNPKDAPKVVVDPGTVKIQVRVEKDGKTFDMEAKVVANSTWGVMFDTSFQEVFRLY